MSLTINVSPQLDHELVREAIRDGIAPNVRAELLLRLAIALRPGGSENPFGSAVREFLRQHGIDPDRLASVLDQLNDECVPNARHPVKTVSPNVDTCVSNGREIPKSLLRRWREDEVHETAESRARMEVEINSPRPSILGKYAFIPFSSDDHAREKQEELEREDRKYGGRGF